MSHTVISLRQPWAGLLVSGVKRYELRSWRPKAPSGWLLIHASKGKAIGLPEKRTHRVFQMALAKAGMQDESLWEQSAIIGAVYFRHFRDWYKEEYPDNLSVINRYLVGDDPPQFLWEVGKASRFSSSFPCDGRLSLWKTDGTLTRSISQTCRHQVPDYVKWSGEA